MTAFIAPPPITAFTSPSLDPTGTVDSSLSIQKILDHLGAGVDQGGWEELSRGNFLVSGMLTMYSSTRLSGPARGSAANAASPSRGARLIAASTHPGPYMLSVGNDTQPIGYAELS